MTMVEGGKHTKVQFDDRNVTTIPRHPDVNELTAKGIIKTAENWANPDDE